jgi:prolyl 4-hydroxylase
MDFLYAIDNLLSPSECEKYIKMFDNPQLVETINDKHRKYHRVQFQDSELAKQLYDRVKSYIPKKIKKISVGMNSYFRLSKYESGQFFGIHKDGINFDSENRQNMSYATLNIFLNENFEGGETIFYENDKKTVTLNCKPKAGRGSFFYSQQFHEGAKIRHGYKYLLRTDLMINHNKSN